MLKLGYNEATCKENSTVENDLLLCEKYGYDYIELRLDMLQEYLKTHTVDDLKAFFAKSHIKPFAFNSIENINFCTPEEWEKLVELFTFGCKVAQQIGNPFPPISRAAESLPADIPLPPGTTGRCVRPQCQPAQ